MEVSPDEVKSDLTGSTVDFSLSPDYKGHVDARGLIKPRRVLATKEAVFRKITGNCTYRFKCFFY